MEDWLQEATNARRLDPEGHGPAGVRRQELQEVDEEQKPQRLNSQAAKGSGDECLFGQFEADQVKLHSPRSADEPSRREPKDPV